MTLRAYVKPPTLLFLVLWLILLAGGRSRFFQDSDTFWHTVVGEKVLHDGFIDTDSFTFTRHGQKWIPNQWLGEVLMALVQEYSRDHPATANGLFMASNFAGQALIIFLVGFVATVIVFKFGTQLSAAAADTYDAIKNYQEILTWVFQIAALYIFYITSRALVTASGVFRSAPWAYPMTFVAIGLIPTIKVILNMIHRVEGRHT